MPSKSKAQAKLMRAVEHNEEFAEKVGIPQKVGKDFRDADRDAGVFQGSLGSKAKPHAPMAHHSKGRK